jgi:2-polyprenyl-6-hydroxyphenyl methylase/3-demethylubiquinone-9 3-methyltransferase
MTTSTNHDPQEIARFDANAQRWWDPHGEFRPLHALNPVRLDYVDNRAGLAGKRVLDVGCGGGLLSEAMAREGAQVTGLDLAPDLVEIAKLHLLETNLRVDYRLQSVEALAAEAPASFDAITCMEMLEHVPDPASVLAACATLLAPGGRLLLSTLNRTPAAFAVAIVGAEYVAGLLPRGTHSYGSFIKPSELGTWLREAGFELEDVSGLAYDPIRRRAWVGKRTDVNYLACARRP